MSLSFPKSAQIPLVSGYQNDLDFVWISSRSASCSCMTFTGNVKAGIFPYEWSFIFFFSQGVEDLIGIDHPVERGLEFANLIITEQFNFRVFQLLRCSYW